MDVHLELRTKKLLLAREHSESVAFINAHITNMSVGVAQTERHLTRMKVGFDSIVLRDMFEETDWPLLRTVAPPKFSYTLVRILPWNLISIFILEYRSRNKLLNVI
jgi:hypothetical protein